MARFLIVGGSFGGLTTAFELRRSLGSPAKIAVLSDTERFTFLPSLPWLAMGYKRPESLVFDIRKPLARKGIEFIRGEASSIDPARQIVTAEEKELPYDYLIMATGASLDFEAIPGLGPTAHTTSILTLEHSLAARDRLGRVLGKEEGHIVVGSAQGASCLGPAYELILMIDQELRRRHKRHRFHLDFITPEPFLGHFGIGGMGKASRLFEDEFADRDIGFHLNAVIVGVAADSLSLADGTILRHDFAMIVPSFLGVPAVRDSPGVGNPKGFIPVDDRYAHPSIPNLYAVGVSVAIPPPATTPVPVGVPKTGNMTLQMATAAARSMAAAVRNEAAPPGQPLSITCLADAGNTAFFMSAAPVLPPRQRMFAKKGRWAHFLKIGLEQYLMWKLQQG